MKGMNEMTVNEAVLREALQEYFNRRLNAPGFMNIESVRVAKSAYMGDKAEATIVFKDTVSQIEVQEKSA